jgi:micrococcal nuclease
VDPNSDVQPYGPQASQFTTTELEGERVGLEFDQEREDQFGRLLAYVHLSDGSLFNETLLRQGYAQLYIVPRTISTRPALEQLNRKQESQNVGCGSCRRVSFVNLLTEATA